MASLRTIRSRIRSTRNMLKITKALKLVSAAKLRRAQDAVVRARPYAQLLDEMLSSLAQARDEAGLAPHPLMAVRPQKRVEVLLLTSDRGLCGGFNANIIRRAQRFTVEEGPRFDKLQFSTIGKRGREFARTKKLETRKDYVGFFGKLKFPMAKQIADDLIAEYQSGELDAVYLLYNEFKSAISQSISLKPLLPIVPPAPAQAPATPPQGQATASAKSLITPEHLFEPSRQAVLEQLLPRQLAMQIWRSLLESEASEHGARMTAMDSATTNASDMIASLTLQYNRARQAAITKELMEIVSGAEAMR